MTASTETLSPTGMFVWWNLDDSRVTPDNLRSILADEGFTPKIAVPDIEPSAGIKRACTEWSQGRGKADRYRCEVTSEQVGSITVGLLTRHRVNSKEVEWVQVGLLEYTEANASWLIATDAAKHDDALNAFKELAVARMTYLDHRWIRPNVLTFALANARATNLRKGAGFYFAPKQHMDEMKRLRRVVSRIGNSELRIAVVGNDEDTVESVTGATRESLVTTIAEVQDQLKSWSGSDRVVRSDSQMNILAELADAIALAETYEAALGIRLDDLRSDIEGARLKALSIIADKAA